MPSFSRLLFLAVLAASASVRSAPISSVETADGLNVHVHATERAAPPHVDAPHSLYAGTRRNSRSEESDLSTLLQLDSERLVHMLHKRTGPAPQRSPPEGGTEPTEPESGSASGHKAGGPMPTRSQGWRAHAYAAEVERARRRKAQVSRPAAAEDRARVERGRQAQDEWARTEPW